MGITAAIRRLLVLSLVILFVLGFALFWLRFLGLSTAYVKPSYELIDKGPWVFASGHEDWPRFSKEGYSAAKNLSSRVILAVDVRPTRDLQWVVFGRARLEDETDGHGALENHTWDELSQLKRKADPPQPALWLLKDFLAEHGGEPLLFVVHSAEIMTVNSLLELLQSRKDQSQTLITSPYGNMLRELRSKRPLWLFGTDPASITKLRLMNALFLEPIAEMRADFVSTPWSKNRLNLLSPRLLQEFARRHKPIVIEDLGPEAEGPPLSIQGQFLGILTSRPQWALKHYAAILR